MRRDQRRRRSGSGGVVEPEVDEAVESEVRDENLRGKDLHGGGTRVVA